MRSCCWAVILVETKTFTYRLHLWSVCSRRQKWHCGCNNTDFIVLLKLLGAASYTDKREKKCTNLLRWLPEEGGRESLGGNTANLWEKLCNRSFLAAGAWWSAAAVSLAIEPRATEALKTLFVRMENEQFLCKTLLKYEDNSWHGCFCSGNKKTHQMSWWRRRWRIGGDG